MCKQEVFEALKYRIEVDRYGTRRYYNNAGSVHRKGGPAIEFGNGNEYLLHIAVSAPIIDRCGRTQAL